MNPHLAAYLDSIDGVERPEQPPQSTHSELCGDKSVASRVERWGSCLLLISLRLWLVEAVVYLVYFTHEIALDIPLLRSAVSSIVMKYSCILLLMMAMPLTAFTWSVFAAVLALPPLLVIALRETTLSRIAGSSKRSQYLLRVLCHSIKQGQLLGLGRQLVHPLPPAASLHRALEVLKSEKHSPVLIATREMKESLLVLLKRMVSLGQELEIASCDSEELQKLSLASVSSLESNLLIILSAFHEYAIEAFQAAVEDLKEILFENPNSEPSLFASFRYFISTFYSKSISLLLLSLRVQTWEIEIEKMLRCHGLTVSNIHDIGDTILEGKVLRIHQYLRFRRELLDYRLALESAAYSLWLTEKQIATIPLLAFTDIDELEGSYSELISRASMQLEEIAGRSGKFNVIHDLTLRLRDFGTLKKHVDDSCSEIIKSDENIEATRNQYDRIDSRTPTEQSIAPKKFTQGLYGDEEVNEALQQENCALSSNVVEVYSAIVAAHADSQSTFCSSSLENNNGTRLTHQLLQELETEIAVRREMFIEKQCTPDPVQSVKASSTAEAAFSQPENDQDLLQVSSRNQVALANVLNGALLARRSDESNAADQYVLES